MGVKRAVHDNDDLTVISRVLLGDSQAFSVIVERYEIKLRDFCERFLGEKDLAEDAAQETLVKAFHALKRFKPTAKFSTWLFRIARNQCIDLVRKQKTQRETSFEDGLSRGALLTESITSGASDQFSIVAARDLLDKLLQTLPENYREIIILRELHGMSYQELAEITDSSLDSVKGCLKRARAEVDKSLRHLLEGENVNKSVGKGI